MINASDIEESRAAGRPIRMTLPGLIRHMCADHADMIQSAVSHYTTHFHTGPLQSMQTGSDTATRMACRLADGMTIDAAAFREFDYRLSLALRSRTFPAPCLIGM